jgi:hypothetical protein
VNNKREELQYLGSVLLYDASKNDTVVIAIFFFEVIKTQTKIPFSSGEDLN